MSEEKKPTLPTSEETEKCVQIFKAFGNDTRYRILYLLFEQALSVKVIVEAVGLTQSAVSHQLKILRQTGLVISLRDGQRVLYHLADRHVMTIFQAVKEHIAED